MEKDEKNADGSQLRRQAEKELETMHEEIENLSGMSPEDITNLIHELRVHQIELKMQNDELRRIQGELEKTRDRYSHLYDFAPVGYLTVGKDGLVAEANLTAAVLLEMERSALIGSPFTRFVLGEDQDIFYFHRKCLLETEEPQSFRLRLVKKDGSDFYANLECMLVDEGDGGRKQIRTVVIDITEQKDLEDSLRQAQKMEAIGTLAGGIAHDFNNILSAVIGFTELSLGDAKEGTSLAKNLEEVLIGGKRAKLLIQQILTFSRQSPQKKQPIRLIPLVKEATRMLRSMIPSNIEIDIDIRSTNPCVMGDETQFHQIILNLCTNAVHAMETDGGRLTICLEDSNFGKTEADKIPDLLPGKYIKFSVSDTGIGIATENVEHIFEPYFTTKDPERGTGMGLAVIQGIVKSHSGHIAVMTKPQKGTTFNIYLPMLEEIKTVSDHKPRKELPGGSEHILLVDDELSILKLNRLILEKLGYTVTTKARSMEALELFRAKPDDFELVITDMAMPNMTGDKLPASW